MAGISRPWLAVLLLAAAGTASPQSVDCDRECLRTALTQYLQAVVENKPENAGIIVGFRQTENAVVTRPGTGTWQSVTALGPVQRHYLDPESQQAAYFGLVEEGTELAVVTVRVRLVDRQVAEAEWYLARKGDPGMQGPAAEDSTRANLYDPQNLIANPPPEERNVPRRERLSRASLLGVANSYFDAITTHDGALMMSSPECLRLENGVTVTGRPLTEGRTDGYRGRTNCSSGIGPTSALNIVFVADRRYPIVDEQQQVVVATAVFLRNQGALNRRNGLSEYFFIDDGLISQVYAAMFYPAPSQPVPNWPPYDGNFPLPASFGDGR
jgi:hypothetical protein